MVVENKLTEILHSISLLKHDVESMNSNVEMINGLVGKCTDEALTVVRLLKQLQDCLIEETGQKIAESQVELSQLNRLQEKYKHNIEEQKQKMEALLEQIEEFNLRTLQVQNVKQSVSLPSDKASASEQVEAISKKEQEVSQIDSTAEVVVEEPSVEKQSSEVKKDLQILEKAVLEPAFNDASHQSFVQNQETVAMSFNELLEKKNLSDFRKAFSLNDRFRFRRELFGNNEVLMNQVIADLNDRHNYSDSIAYITEHLHWDMEQEAVVDFVKLIEKRFL